MDKDQVIQEVEEVSRAIGKHKGRGIYLLRREKERGSQPFHLFIRCLSIGFYRFSPTGFIAKHCFFYDFPSLSTPKVPF